MSTKRPPYIVAAANKLPTGVILVGARHWDTVMRDQMKAIYGDDWADSEAEHGVTHSDIEQGFIDQYGRFHSRQAALAIVKANGQPLRNPDAGVELYSEDLY